MQELNLRHPTPEVGALSTELIALNFVMIYKINLNSKLFLTNVLLKFLTNRTYVTFLIKNKS